MLQRTILILFFLSSQLALSQSLMLDDLTKICTMENEDEKFDFLYKKGFNKLPGKSDGTVEFSLKKFIKKIQTFDEEVVRITSDTLIYGFNDSKKFIKVKGKVETFYKKENDTYVYKQATRKKVAIIQIFESEEIREYKENLIKFYNFKVYLKAKSDF